MTPVVPHSPPDKPTGAPPFHARPSALPRNPAVAENGQRLCGEALTVDGRTVGYCGELVWPPQMQGRWFRRPGHPGKPHRIEWWSA